MRYLGIDYGEKRIGVAVSDPLGRIAFPKKTIFNRGMAKVMAEFRALVEEEKISLVVLGLPIGLDGKDTDQTLRVRDFAENLKKELKIEVKFENEMLTTHYVEGPGLIKKEHTDEAAAAVILQSYLDKISH